MHKLLRLHPTTLFSAPRRLTAIAFLATVVASAPSLASDASAKEAAFNSPPTSILFIAVDDLNDWVGCLGGHPDTLTPNIDRIAARGTLFTNAQCAAPACVPSRSAVMTGLLPATSGLYTNFDGEFQRYPDLAEKITIPQYFSQHGYHTAGAGKITHSGPNKKLWDDPCPIVYFKNPLPPGVPENSRRNKAEYLPDWLPLDVDKTEMTDWKLAQWTAERLSSFAEKRHAPKPGAGGVPQGGTRPASAFFACGFYRPHVPLHAPRHYYDKFPLDKIALPKIKLDDLDDLSPARRKPSRTVADIVSDETAWRKGVQAYLANINFADECVGVLLDALDASPIRDNTIVILWSDHGLHQGEKFQFSKFTLWEEAARCVLVAAGPGITRGARCNEPVSLIDLYPTLIDLCNLPPRDDLDGASLLPQLKNPAHPRDTPAITANGKGFSVRSNRWRYILNHNDNSEELYDHETDPMEWHNLLALHSSESDGGADNPEYASIKKKLAASLPSNPAPLRNPKR